MRIRFFAYFRHPLFRWLLIAACLVAASMVGCTRLDTWQRQTIFSPEPDPQRWWQEAPQGTEIYDLVLDNGDRVRTWYWAHPDLNAPTVLYLHGSRWNLNGSVFRTQRWMDMGFSVLAIDYRGFGESTPLLPSEESAFEDAAAGLHELARRQPKADNRFIYGHSLGGAIAIDLATRPDLPEFAGLIVESSFTSTRAMLGTLEWGGLPGAGLLVTQRFDSARKLASLATPLLLIHGTDDHVVPHTMSDELYEAASQLSTDMKQLIKIEGGSHSGSIRHATVYEAAVTDFIRDARRQYDVTQNNQGVTSRLAKP